VSEVGDWIKPDLDRYTMEVETSLQLMMAHLLPEMDAKVQARQEKDETLAAGRW
jgi:hypothetical protein